MSTLRRFRLTDTFRCTTINLDSLTATFTPNFYSDYFITQSPLCKVSQAPSGTISGYMIAKVEGKDQLYHAHVSAVTIAMQYRRIGLARLLMKDYEDTSARIYNPLFSDLYVRSSNYTAVQMYKKLKYIVYRRVLGYYGDEDAYDMRRSLPRDQEKLCEIPLSAPTHPSELDNVM